MEVSFELLNEHTNLEVVGNKGYISAEKAKEMWQANWVQLRMMPHLNQKDQMPREVAHTFNTVRQLIETVNSHLIG
ncbi:MAG: hypothetical protein H5T33_07605 [Candidatus Methanosuratus sp.]|nr:hypothetical protein [Candidatus Methanosuratincola sp.]